MTRKSLTIRSIVLMLLAGLAVFALAINQAKRVSANENNQYLTSVSLQDTTNPGATKYGPIDDMHVTYGFKIPKDSLSSSNDSLTVKVPEQFNLQAVLNFDIKDANNNVIGKATANPSTKTVSVKFTDFGMQENKNGDITGTFDITLKWDLNHVNTGVTTTINWNLPDKDGTTPNATDVIVNPATGPAADEKLAKWSWYDPDNANIIHWAIRVNYQKLTVHNAVLTDTIGPGQKIVGTFTGKKAEYDANGNLTSTTEIYTDSAFSKDSDTSFHLNMGDINSTYLIYYETEITDGGAMKKYGNTVDLTGSDIQKQEQSVNSPTYSGSGSASSNGSGDNTPDTPDTPKNQPVAPTTPTGPNTPAVPENSNQSNNSQSKSASTPASTTQAAAPAPLPETGKKTNESLLLVGLVAGMTTAGLYFVTRKH